MRPGRRTSVCIGPRAGLSITRPDAERPVARALSNGYTSDPAGAAHGTQMGHIVWFINTLIQLYIWVLIIGAILSWLVAFNVVNPRNRFVYMVMDFTYRLTEPALRPIRRILPNLGGIDISPVILILLLTLAQRVLADLYMSTLT